MTFDRRRVPADAQFDRIRLRDGWTLRRYRQPARGTRRGQLLWLGGRGDIVEKYLEPLDHWAGRGWAVTSVDWRGQGGSGRLAADPHVGHIEDFALWVDDLAELVDMWREGEGPHVVAAHSMGGHLVLRALVEQRIDIDKASLVAPMLGIDTGGLPFPVVKHLTAAVARVAPQRRAWAGHERPGVPSAARERLLTHDAARYADELWWKAREPALALGPPSLGWLAAAYRSIAVLRAPGSLERIDTPVLLIGSDGDRLVRADAIRVAASRLPRARLHVFDDSVAHEILRESDEPRRAALTLIDEFLA